MFAILQHRGLDVCGTPWGKQLGAGLFEFRIRVERGSVTAQLPPEKVLLRILCHAHGERVILLLAGYDKGSDPSHRRQQAEIAEARRRLADWMARVRSADR